MSKPKISVVTPAFNAEDRLAEIVHEIAQQKYTNIEHIIIDDGSSDKTAEVLLSLSKRWPHLKVIHQSNKGRSVARNRGLTESSGEYILFLDDDDSMSTTAISQMVSCAEKNPNAVIYTDWNVQLESGLNHVAKVRLQNRTVFEAAAISCPFVIHGCLIPRSVAIEAEGFDETLDYAEDWDLWQRFGRAGVQFVGLQKPLVTYDLPERDLSSDTAYAQFQQARAVIERAFESDCRVKNSLPEYKDGCKVRCPEEGLISTLIWFAGIEYAQGADFPWISESAAEISRNSEYIPDSQSLAYGFSAGIGHGRGLGGLLNTALEYPRLKEITAMFNLEDPSVLVPRRTMPTSLPLAVSEVQHCRAGLKIEKFKNVKKAGRVQPWLLHKGIHRRLPAAVYAVNDDTTELKFNIPKGVALTSLDIATRVENLRSLPRRIPAMALNRRLVKNTLIDLAGFCNDRAVKGSKLLNLELPKVKSPRPAPPKGEFDQIFSNEDPWGYDKPYEVRKYEETLELLSDLSEDDVVTEMACAEGHFTARLAPRVKKVRAYDVAPIALERLDYRLKQAGHHNVETAVFDLFTDSLTNESDVVTCSEVLYYMPPDQLDEIVSRLIAGLRQGGTFVHAHAFEATERGSKPGFGWRQPFGVQRISEAFWITSRGTTAPSN